MTSDSAAQAQVKRSSASRGAPPSHPQDCDRQIRKDRDEAAPEIYEGTWSGTPAWVLVYRVPERSVSEAWVVSKAGCDTLYFTQAPL